MKNLLMAGLLFVLVIASTAFALNPSMIRGERSNCQDRSCQVIALSDLTQEIIDDFFTEKTSSYVLECPEGAVLPFHLSLKGDFFSIESDDFQSNIKVLKTCYMKCAKDTFLFSTDLQDWNEFAQFFTGVAGVSLNVEEGNPTVYFNMELNQKS